jgi:hypothetical protein
MRVFCRKYRCRFSLENILAVPTFPRRNGNVRPVVIKGKKAQGWEWIAEELIDPEAAD